MGSSVAWHLMREPAFKGRRVLVVERDATYATSASALSAASIRQQFSSAVNVAISLYGIAFLREIGTRLQVGGERPQIDLHEGGYLYLATAAGAPLLAELNDFQRGMGADIALLDPAALVARFPWLNVEEIAAGNLGVSGEGWFDGWGLLQAFRKAARAEGAEYAADRVVAVTREGDSVVAVTLGSGQTVACGALVDCAGSQGRAIAAMAGIDIPVLPKLRHVFSFSCREEVDNCPLMIDISGAYVRPEGRNGDERQFICGISPAGEADIDWNDADAEANPVDWSLFEETIWPALATRVPAFERIRPGRAWSGPYDMNLFDHNAIVGRAAEGSNVYLCNGFSGHGLQQSPAVGRGLAEQIVHGRFVTLDLADLGLARIAQGRPLLERNVI